MATSADYLSCLSDRFKLGRLGFSVREDETGCKLVSELVEELFTEPVSSLPFFSYNEVEKQYTMFVQYPDGATLQDYKKVMTPSFYTVLINMGMAVDTIEESFTDEGLNIWSFRWSVEK